MIATRFLLRKTFYLVHTTWLITTGTLLATGQCSLTSSTGNTNVSAREGESITLQCRTDVDRFVKWRFRGNGSLHFYLINSEHHIAIQFSGTHSVTFNNVSKESTLVIRNASEAGMYRCVEPNVRDSWIDFKLSIDKRTQTVAEEVSIPRTTSHPQNAKRNGGERNNTQHDSTDENFFHNPNKPNFSAEGGLLLVLLSVATFVMFVLTMTCIIFRGKINGSICASEYKIRTVQNTSAASSSLGYGGSIRPSMEMDSVRGDVDDPIPPLPSRLHSTMPGSCSGSGLNVDYLTTTNTYAESARNNGVNENALPVNLTYSELTVSIRTDRSRSLTRPAAVSASAVYADIDHVLQQRDAKKMTK